MQPLGIVQFPYRGAPTTVAGVRKAALKAQRFYNVRQLAESITRDLRPKDYLSEYLAYYYFVLVNTRYMRDPRTVELVRDPWVIVDEIQKNKRPQLDCDDIAGLSASLVLAGGGQVRLVTAAFRNAFHRGERQYSHIWAEAKEPSTGTWIALDAVANYRMRQMMNRAVAFKIWPVA